MGEVGRNFDSILDLLFHPSNRVAGEWRADSSTRTTYSPLLISQNTHDASRLPCPALTRLLLLSACLHLHTLATGVQTVRAVAPSMLWTPREIPGNFKASQPRLLSPRSLPRSPLHHFVSSFRFPLRARVDGGVASPSRAPCPMRRCRISHIGSSRESRNFLGSGGGGTS